MNVRRQVEQVASMAAVLSNPMRAEIVMRLRDGPSIVGDLVEALGESQATVSKQLALLREAGLLRCRPDGQCREYALASPREAAAVLDALRAVGVVAAAKDAECRAARAARFHA